MQVPQAPAAGRIRLGRTGFIVIQGAKRTFLRTSLALGASLEKEIRKCHVAGPGMHGNPAVYRFNTLNRFKSGSCCIFNGLFHGHAAASNGSGSINTGSLGFIRKANEI